MRLVGYLKRNHQVRFTIGLFSPIQPKLLNQLISLMYFLKIKHATHIPTPNADPFEVHKFG